jgi:hypothetical protein
MYSIKLQINVCLSPVFSNPKKKLMIYKIHTSADTCHMHAAYNVSGQMIAEGESSINFIIISGNFIAASILMIC